MSEILQYVFLALVVLGSAFGFIAMVQLDDLRKQFEAFRAKVIVDQWEQNREKGGNCA